MADPTATPPPHDWQEAIAAGRPTEAIRAYLEQDGADIETEESLRALADVQRELRGKRFHRARRALERAGEASFVDMDGLRQELDLLEKSAKELDRAEPEAALALLESTRQPLYRAEADTQRGTAYIYLNDAERARAHFDRALDADSRHYRAITNRGNLALEEGRLDEAITAYEAALAVDAEFPNALHNLGVAYRRKGEVGKSIQKIKAAQRASRQRDLDTARDTARGSLSGRRGGLPNFLRWALWGAGAAGLYYLLTSQGIL